jgi:hypothetical protein
MFLVRARTTRLTAYIEEAEEKKDNDVNRAT